MDRSVFLQFWFKQLISPKQKMSRTPHIKGNLFSRKVHNLFKCFQAAVVFLIAIILLGRMRCVMRQEVAMRKTMLCTFPLRSQVIGKSWPCCLLRHDTHSWQHDWSFYASPLDIWFAEDTCKLLAKIWCWTFIGINSLSIFVEKEHLLWLVSG